MHIFRVNSSLRFATQLAWILYAIDEGCSTSETTPLFSPTLPLLDASTSQVPQLAVLASRRGTSEPKLNSDNCVGGDSDDNGVDVASSNSSLSEVSARHSISVSGCKLKIVASADKIFPFSSQRLVLLKSLLDQSSSVSINKQENHTCNAESSRPAFRNLVIYDGYCQLITSCHQNF